MTRLALFVVLAAMLTMPFACTPLEVKPVSTQTPKATLITSVPSGVRVEINGKYVGDTPLRVKLSPGRYKITRRKPVRVTFVDATVDDPITKILRRNDPIPEGIEWCQELNQIRTIMEIQSNLE